ncbi:MAG: KH domain-containing protein [Leptospiraceae bacterium]|nr:KH domain-containing protein [Leptospiraceae bacterium]
MSYYLYEAEGKSRAEAEEAALELLGIDADQVEVEAAGSSGGFMRLIKGGPTAVRIYPTENTPRDAHVRGVLMSILEKMGIEAEVLQVGEREGNLYIEVSSEDSGFIIGKHGRTLDAVQFLVNLIVNTNTKSDQRIMVDVEAYRTRRQKSLQKLAKRMADRVAKSGRSILLNYMNPYERRIIHLALEEDDRVYTESDGHGVYKRVRVIPARKKERSGNRRSGGRRGPRMEGSDVEQEFYEDPPRDLEEEEIDDDIGNRALPDDEMDDDYR